MRDRLEQSRVECSPGLDISDVNKIEAAEGYHMIGMYREAAAEIANISPKWQGEPSVLHVACRVHWALRQMPEALACSERFIRAAPNHPFGYGFKAMLLLCLNRPKECYDLLRPAVELFPDHATMHYDLACAAAECKLWSEARHWIYEAISIQPSLKGLALEAAVFAPIRIEIHGMCPAN